MGNGSGMLHGTRVWRWGEHARYTGVRRWWVSVLWGGNPPSAGRIREVAPRASRVPQAQSQSRHEVNISHSKYKHTMIGQRRGGAFHLTSSSTPPPHFGAPTTRPSAWHIHRIPARPLIENMAMSHS